MTLTAADLVADARRQIREINPSEFASDTRGSVLIDVREPAEFETGHIVGAVNIPRGVLEFQVDAHPAVANVSDPALSHKEQPIVVYCRTGGRSALAALNLQRMGFKNVRSLAGGITDWTNAGLPLTQR
ncbi:rhodanese-like domain-containing protein [Aerolutibacter ruishenii]|uniref:Rhodanese-related sulfurtransferase n=1 Tax=Aerolutibacter ruishenii TaxID=686800 RepID=A0A562LJZ9_9GAMM|nr:rhodanese-like domain-containing protein [Lysobacter ruishenii]TWI07960.1 rhodanese-related sulfurtransferase [Lysobacter ruishenii]